jgi:hypothetical protein
MEQQGRRAPGAGGGVDEPVQTDGVGDSPLRPDEYETYRTDQAAGDGSEDAVDASPGSEPRTWIIAGVVLFMVFVVILVWAVLAPLV